MKMSKRLLAISCICLGLSICSIDSALAGEEFVVRGTDWTTSSEKEKLAFLAGMATMIEIEQELQAKSKVKAPKSSIPVLVDGLKDMTITDIVNAVDTHYAGNKDLGKPVFIVIWDLAKANQ